MKCIKLVLIAMFAKKVLSNATQDTTTAHRVATGMHALNVEQKSPSTNPTLRSLKSSLKYHLGTQVRYPLELDYQVNQLKYHKLKSKSSKTKPK
jgi:hypothetical protein